LKQEFVDARCLMMGSKFISPIYFKGVEPLNQCLGNERINNDEHGEAVSIIPGSLRVER